MSNLYSVLIELCEKNKITPYRLCKDTGIQPSVMTDLKMGRRHTVKAETAAKLANYFGVSVDYLLGNEPKEKAPSKVGEGHRPPDEETLHLLEVLENRPDIRYLAAASERATPEHVKATAKMFDELYGRGNDK